MFYLKIRQRLNSNRGPLVSEADAVPTEPQPQPFLGALEPYLIYTFWSDQIDP